MVPSHDPLICRLTSRNAADNIVGRHHLPVELELEMNLGHPIAAYVVGERQSAAPFWWGHRSAEGGQERLCVALRNRQHRDLRDPPRRIERQAMYAWLGA